jgi:hypothetical protein
MFNVDIEGVSTLYTGDYSRVADRHLPAADTPLRSPDIRGSSERAESCWAGVGRSHASWPLPAAYALQLGFKTPHSLSPSLAPCHQLIHLPPPTRHHPLVIVESTYGVSRHLAREVREKRFLDKATATLLRGGKVRWRERERKRESVCTWESIHTLIRRKAGGSPRGSTGPKPHEICRKLSPNFQPQPKPQPLQVLLPIVALGRAQELLLMLDEHWSRNRQLQQYPIYQASGGGGGGDLGGRVHSGRRETVVFLRPGEHEHEHTTKRHPAYDTSPPRHRPQGPDGLPDLHRNDERGRQGGVPAREEPDGFRSLQHPSPPPHLCSPQSASLSVSSQPTCHCP